MLGTVTLAPALFCGCSPKEEKESKKIYDRGPDGKNMRSHTTETSSRLPSIDPSVSTSDPGNPGFTGDVNSPDTSVISGIADKFLKEGSTVIALDDQGKYQNTNSQLAMLDYQQYLKEYLFSEECYERTAATMPGSGIESYEDYVEQMKTLYGADTPELDENNKLQELPQNRVFFAIQSLYAQGFDQTISSVLAEACISRGFNLLFDDNGCNTAICNSVKENKVFYDTAYIYVICIIPVSDSSAYVLIRANTLDSSRNLHCAEFVSLNGEQPVQQLRSLQISAQDPEYSPIFVHLPAGDQSQELLDEIEAFHDRFGSPSTNGITWKDGPLPTGIEEEMTPTLVAATAGSSLQTSLSYRADGTWFYTSLLDERETFTVSDHEAERTMLDLLYRYVAQEAFKNCSCLLPSLQGNWTIDTSKSYDQTRIAPEEKDKNASIIMVYKSEDIYQSTTITFSGDDLYYCDDTIELYDVQTTDTPFYQTTDFYEFYKQGDEAFFRPDTTDVFYSVDPSDFRGKRTATLISKMIADEYEFKAGYELDYTPDGDAEERANESWRLPGWTVTDRIPVSCEYYTKGSSTLVVFLNADGRLLCGWEYNPEGLTIYYAISEDSVEMDLTTDMEHARNHLGTDPNDSGDPGSDQGGQGQGGNGSSQPKPDSEKNEEDWIVEDVAEHGYFDLTGNIVEGDAIEGSPVVQKYMEYFASLSPFIFEYWEFGNYRVNNYFLTLNKDGDFCDAEIVSSHDNSFDYDMTRVKIGDTIYTSSESDGSSRSDKIGPEYVEDEILYSLPDVMIPSHNGTFKRAYYATVNGDEYIIEEWTYRGETTYFFCKDSEILAMKYQKFGNTFYAYVSRYEHIAADARIKKPT
ncbi:MAG: hypothetical protein J5379_00695 [Clostridiales bacterium]|nr:hypothetical protein [Clostridiales bacterium]